MKLPFKKRIWVPCLIFMSGFLLLFIFRLIYSYSSKSNDAADEFISNFMESSNSHRKNYASDKYSYKKEVIEPNQPQQAKNNEVSVSQKYEKTATLQNRTNNFDQDEKLLKKTIKDFNSIIQYEQLQGNKGKRNLELSIGTPPENFEKFFAQVSKIGLVKSSIITKVDKTNEFKQLNAKKTSLEKIRNSLIDLKKQSGKIEEFVKLENRILEIEDTLQGLGVELGNFDEENEFCTVILTLSEGKIITMSLLHRLKVSFEWTVNYFLQIILILAVILFSSFIILLIIDKLKILTGIIKKINE